MGQDAMANTNAELVCVDLRKCAEVAGVLARHPIPSTAEEHPNALGLPASALPNFYLLTVAICHQTSPVGQPRLGGTLTTGETVWGWDYLRRRFAERAREKLSILDPACWPRLTAGDLVELLAAEDGPVHVSDPERRAALIRDAGTRMAINRWSGLEAMYAAEDGWLVREHRGMLVRLSEFDAYRDPVRKKSYYLLELLRNECRWHYRDPQNLGAPIDSHEVRGHLRLGTVRVLAPGLEARLSARAPVDHQTDVAIRTAVARAIAEIAAAVGSTDSPTLHYLFWNVFRSCCGRDATHCWGCRPDCVLPGRYRRDAAACPLAPACASRGAPILVEHHHETDFY
jgi:hypothetical protein